MLRSLLQRDVLGRRDEVLRRERSVRIGEDTLEHENAVVPGDLGDDAPLQFGGRDGEDDLLFGSLPERRRRRETVTPRESKRACAKHRPNPAFGSITIRQMRTLRCLRPTNRHRVPDPAARHGGISRVVERATPRKLMVGRRRRTSRRAWLRQPAVILAGRPIGVLHSADGVRSGQMDIYRYDIA